MLNQTHTDEMQKLKSVAQFAGMTNDEIGEWIAINVAREHAQWEAEFQAKLEKQRSDDLEKIKSKTLLDLNPRPVLVEDCIRLDINGKKLYLDRARIRHALTSRGNLWYNQ
jgi:hypothetical protein